MPKGIIGRKVGMTQIFDKDGNLIPVTVIQAGPCTVLRKKSAEGKDGYAAIVLGYEDVRSAEVDGEIVYKARKPNLGVFKAAGLTPKRHLREIRVLEHELDKYEIGQNLGPEVFVAGDSVDVSGVSKGKGYAGVMKRHHMAGFKGSHGTHEFFRHGGSIGTSATPSRVFKGKRMAGQLGNANVTVQNVRVYAIDTEKGLLLLRGGVPGATGALVVVKDAVKRRRRASYQA